MTQGIEDSFSLPDAGARFQPKLTRSRHPPECMFFTTIPRVIQINKHEAESDMVQMSSESSMGYHIAERPPLQLFHISALTHRYPHLKILATVIARSIVCICSRTVGEIVKV